MRRGNAKSGVQEHSSEEQPCQAVQLQWSEVRRIQSEPFPRNADDTSRKEQDKDPRLLLPSVASEGSDEVFLDVALENGGCGWREKSGEPSQFSNSTDQEKIVAEDDTSKVGTMTQSVTIPNGTWQEWIIPANEVSLGAILHKTKSKTVYSGYWHGQVHVHTQESETLEDFLLEASTLTCIRHENIQLFMGICLDMHTLGAMATVMSELKGESLYTRLHKYGHNFTAPSKAKILKQITEGMEYLHAKGIPHGLLSTYSIYLHYRVCLSFSPQVKSSRTFHSTELTYLPPEFVREVQAENGNAVLHNKKPSFMADTFAFGTVVYELLTLEKPFKAFPVEALIWQVGHGELPSLTHLPRDCYRGLISHCWLENPALRPTFKEILSIIEQNVLIQTAHGHQRRHSLPSLEFT